MTVVYFNQRFGCCTTKTLVKICKFFLYTLRYSLISNMKIKIKTFIFCQIVQRTLVLIIILHLSFFSILCQMFLSFCAATFKKNFSSFSVFQCQLFGRRWEEEKKWKNLFLFKIFGPFWLESNMGKIYFNLGSLIYQHSFRDWFNTPCSSFF